MLVHSEGTHNSLVHILSHQRQPCSLPGPGHLHRHLCSTIHTKASHGINIKQMSGSRRPGKKTRSLLTFVLTLASHSHCDVNIYLQFTVSGGQRQLIKANRQKIEVITCTSSALTCCSLCPLRTRTSSMCLCTQ